VIADAAIAAEATSAAMNFFETDMEFSSVIRLTNVTDRGLFLFSDSHVTAAMIRPDLNKLPITPAGNAPDAKSCRFQIRWLMFSDQKVKNYRDSRIHRKQHGKPAQQTFSAAGKIRNWFAGALQPIEDFFRIQYVGG
jgi:hypothetical protein